MGNELVYILLVNYNSWPHTLECLSSIFKNEYKQYKVIVCENSSTDDSWERMLEWKGKNRGVLCFEEGEKGLYELPPADESIIFIKNKTNKGFAGGINTAMNHAFLDVRCKYLWVLNNDTIIERTALKALVKEMESDEEIGMCGSTILYYDEPHMVQALGGSSYNKWMGVTRYIGNGKQGNELKNVRKEKVLEKMDCLAGASMLLRRSLVEETGPFSEEYFLYYEEMDYAQRIKGRYKLGYAPDSVVYHKEGASIGGSVNNPANKSRTADFYSLRNKLLFTKKYFSRYLPTVYLSFLPSILLRIMRGQYSRVPVIFKIIFNKNQASDPS